MMNEIKSKKCPLHCTCFLLLTAGDLFSVDTNCLFQEENPWTSFNIILSSYIDNSASGVVLYEQPTPTKETQDKGGYGFCAWINPEKVSFYSFQ